MQPLLAAKLLQNHPAWPGAELVDSRDLNPSYIDEDSFLKRDDVKKQKSEAAKRNEIAIVSYQFATWSVWPASDQPISRSVVTSESTTDC